MAQQIGLANAAIFNPQLLTQSALPAALLSLLGVVVLFASDLHHLLIRAVFDSYALFPAGAPLPMGDLTEAVTRAVARSFLIGVQLASPLLVVGLLLFIGLGVIARLLPQIQIFFLSLPLQVGLGLAAFAIVMPPVVLLWLGHFQDTFIGLLGRG